MFIGATAKYLLDPRATAWEGHEKLHRTGKQDKRLLRNYHY